ncbi:siderophore-interacting protein [Pseudomonas aeruginosa]|uniref:siderophore-interacting protein n=1 Tax=Pseudomonas aeruginosa TaxID=287 RepID=UPI00287FA605|nr:siderophore-interacting protein [Pseudomonas aeruginosa]
MSLAETLARNLRDLTLHAGLAKVPSYRLFDLVLKRRSPLSPSLVRFTFGGPEIARVRTLAPDQRVKLLFPAADGSLSQLPATGDWRRQVRSLEARRRPPMRTYTIRALRREAGEVDIDFVLHGETGPASRWAAHARPGERLVMSAPDGEYSGDPGGYEWRPPKDIRHILLIGDETALPAIAGILEELADRDQRPTVQAFIEIPRESDRLDLRCAPETQLNWLARDVAKHEHGQEMLRAASELATLPEAGKPQRVSEVDIDRQVLWELAKPTNGEFYAWVAGESAAVMAIRRHWTGELGLDRRTASFMGYWRQGKAST